LSFFEAGRTIASEKGILNLLSNCSNLENLCYEGSGGEQDLLVLKAVHQCPLLQELRLWWFSFNQQEQGQIADTFTLINRNRNDLCKLTLDCCDLSASTLRTITRMENLDELELEQCRGLTGAGISLLATMNLVTLSVNEYDGEDGTYESFLWTEAHLQPFEGSNISQTLETFQLIGYDNTTLVDDVQVATALASCHNLKTLHAECGPQRGCVFGRNGLEGLQAIATGCPLLADVSILVTVPGLHYLATHFPNLKKCRVLNSHVARAPTPEGFPSIEELQTLYPAVKWTYW
jgi:hypothetical protein